jgi:type IV fimbrial biogenesis protein FimT
MLVTISIATILASIAVPSFTTLIRNNQVSAGTNELVSALVLARSEALKRSQNVSICVSHNQVNCATGGTDFAKGWMVFTDCNLDGAYTAGGALCPDVDGDGNPDSEQVIKVHNTIAGLGITKSSTASYMSYNFAGRLGGATTIFSVIPSAGPSGSKAKNLVVSLTGRVRTQDAVKP